MEEKKVTKIKDILTDFYYMSFIVVFAIFSFLSGIIINLFWSKGQIQKTILINGWYFVVLKDDFVFCFPFICVLSLFIALISYFIEKDLRKTILIFITSLILNVICVLASCSYMIYLIYTSH